MEDIVELLKKEIKAVLMGKFPEKSQSHANGYISGIYTAIDIIENNFKENQ